MWETKPQSVSILLLMIVSLFAITIMGSSSASAMFYSNDGYNVNDWNSNVIQGNKDITDKSYEVNQFTEIEASGSLNISVSSNYSNKIQVKTDDNLQDHITVKVESGILKLGIKGNIKPSQPVQIKVPYYVGLLEKIYANSSAKIAFETDIVADNFSALSSSSSVITLNSLQVNNDVLLGSSSVGSIIINNLNAHNAINATCSSMGSIQTLNSGQANTATLKSSSSGKIKMDVVNFNTVDAESSSSAYISFIANKGLTIRAMSFGEIAYKGESTENNIVAYSFGKVSKLKWFHKNYKGEIYYFFR